MQRERITEDIYVFTSDRYAQVTASAIVTRQGTVLIGTLVYPEETTAIKRYIETRLKSHVTTIINTHYHADHSAGTCFFPGAQVIAHQQCYGLLDTKGRTSLEQTIAQSPEMEGLQIVLPDITFTGDYKLELGGKTFHLWETPGHTDDSIVCYLEGDEILFGADTIMPIPYFIDGDYTAHLRSLQQIQARMQSDMSIEAIVPGYGDIVLRGEVEEKLQGDIDYLVQLGYAVDDALNSTQPDPALQAITIESCGKSRVLLNGMVSKLHQQNVAKLAHSRQQP